MCRSIPTMTSFITSKRNKYYWANEPNKANRTNKINWANKANWANKPYWHNATQILFWKLRIGPLLSPPLLIIEKQSR